MTAQPHIVHVLHSLGIGGTENGAVNLIQALQADARHTVISMTGTGPLAARLPRGVAVHCLHKQPGWDLRAMMRLVGLLRRLRPHLVHSRNWGAFDAILAARLTGVPRVIHGEHGREADDPAGRNRRRNHLRRALAPFVNRFVTVSHDLGRWLIDVVGIAPERVLTIHNGVDTRRFSVTSREAARRTLGLETGQVAIATVARLDPVKDQMGLLDAMGRLTSVDPRAVLLIIGDGPCRQSLEARARSADLAGRVHFLGARTDVPLLLQGFDVFVLPSLAEGISNTILEAMATGLPVIASRTGGNPELVEDGVTGTLVPVGDRDALATSLALYLASAPRRRQHGTAGRQRVVAQFGLDRMTHRYRDLYGHLTADLLPVRAEAP